MTSTNYKVTEIYGYSFTLSLREIEEIFFSAIDSIYSEKYKVIFNENQVELDPLQQRVIEELKELGRNIAYVTQGSALVAIIGYH